MYECLEDEHLLPERRTCGTAGILSNLTIRTDLSFLLASHAGHDGRFGAVVAERQLGPASQTLSVIRDLAEDAEADAADEAHVYNLPVTETGGSEIYHVSARCD